MLDFTIDMDTGVVNMTANEPIDPATFTSFGLAFQSAKNSFNGQGIYVTAVVSGILPVFKLHENNRAWSFTLNRADVNAIKGNSGIYNTIDDCYISAYQSFVTDSNGNEMTSVNFDVFVAMQATTFLPDISPPTLEYWVLDLNVGAVELYMSEVIFIQVSTCTAV